MKRPKLVVKRKPMDYLAEGLSYLAVGISFILPLLYYQELPEELPLHFDASGTADRFGSKNSIWILPVIGAVLCLGINRLIQFPHLFNYPHKITPSNAAENYQVAQRVLRYITLIITGSVAYITYEIILTSLGRSEGLSMLFLVLFTVLMIGIPIFFLLKMRHR